MKRFTEESNAHDRVIMNKIIALQMAQKSNYIPKGKLFLKKQSEEDRSSSSQIPYTLAPTNAVEPDSSSKV